MNVMLWLAGILAGVGIGWVGGFFHGAWSQRTLAAQLEQWVQAREVQRRKSLLEKQAESPPGAAWGGAKIEGKGSEHPAGKPPPTPDQVRISKQRDPENWVSKLKTGTGLGKG